MKTICLLALLCHAPAGWRARAAGVYLTAATDAAATQYFQAHNPRFHETDPLGRWCVKSGPGCLWPGVMSEAVTVNAASLWLDKRHSKLWWIPQTASISAHGGAILYTFKIQL